MRILLWCVLIFQKFSCNLFKKKLSIETQNKELIISIQKTPCFGTCPVYNISIFSDGTGIYKGIQFVEKMGEYEFSIDSSASNKILKEAIKIDFIDIKEHDYFAPRIQDLPTTTITIDGHRVKYNRNTNKELIYLTEYIHDNVKRKIQK